MNEPPKELYACAFNFGWIPYFVPMMGHKNVRYIPAEPTEKRIAALEEERMALRGLLYGAIHHVHRSLEEGGLSPEFEEETTHLLVSIQATLKDQGHE